MNGFIPRRVLLAVCLVLAGATAARIATAADEPMKMDVESLDEQLLRDLNGPESGANPSQVKRDQAEEGDAQPGENALQAIGRRMKIAESLIRAPASEKRAIALQERVVEDLAKLIQAEENRKRKTKAGQQSKRPAPSRPSSPPPESDQPQGNEQPSNQPAKDSSARVDKKATRAVDATTAKGLMSDAWGALPERERQQMLQSPPEEFLPKYELMIENFYKRLANERKK